MSAIKQALLFLPNVVRLTAALAKDPRVPGRTKAFLAVATAYFLSPFDLIPDWIPIIGWFDDAIVALLVLDVIINEIDSEIVLEHWHGSRRALKIAGKAASVAGYIIPKRIKRRLFKQE